MSSLKSALPYTTNDTLLAQILLRSPVALLTIGTKVLLRDILQGTMRLRQFMTTQSVQFVLTEAVAELIRARLNLKKEDKVGIENIILHSSVNEDEKQERENKRLAFIKIDDLIRTQVLEILQFYIDDKKFLFEKYVQAIKIIRPLFVRCTKERPEAWIESATNVEVEIVLKNYMDSRLKLLSKAFPSETVIANALRAELLRITGNIGKKLKDERLRNFLPAKLSVRGSTGRHSNALGIELLLQMELKLEQEIKLEQLSCYLFEKSSPKIFKISPLILEAELNGGSFSALPINRQWLDFANEEFIKPITSSFSDFNISIDLLQPNEYTDLNYLVDSRSQDDLAMAFVRNQKLWALILLSSQAVQTFFAEVNENDILRDPNTKIWMTDLAGRSIRDNYPGTELFTDQMFNSHDVQKAYFHLLLVNLSFNHIFSNPRMRSEFDKWLREYNERQTPILLDLLNYKKDQLSFIGYRLSGFGKGKLMYPKHPFVQLLSGAVNGHLNAFDELLKLFPNNGESEFLPSKDLTRNIWKFVPAKKKCLEILLDEFDDKDDYETDAQDTVVLIDPFKRSHTYKSR